MEEEDEDIQQQQEQQGKGGKAMVMFVSGTLIYYHCSFRNSSFLSLLSDVFLVILSSLAILGLLFRHLNISVPVDPLEWQISHDAANNFFACLANTVGAAESVLRVAATGHDKKLFVQVVISLYSLSVLGRMISGVTIAYAGLCLLCLYMFLESSLPSNGRLSRGLRRENATDLQDIN
ncbi:reticulon-like protein B23 [Silene latifolia]|uniref:reticulon-like protein B23 n=1 Tax=Silene latifolia TaxID=37657 RepID=UPI003D784B99